MSEKNTGQEWYFNLTVGISNLIKEEQQLGYMIKAVVVSSFIASKIENIIGHEPTQICGYVLEILPDVEFEEGFDSFTNEDGETYTQDDVDGYVGLRTEPIC